MRRRHVTPTVVALLAVISGCGRTPVEHTVRKVSAPSGEQTPTDLPRTKEDCTGALEAGLAKLEEEIHELRVKTGTLERTARAEWDEKLAKIEAKRKTAREKLDALAEATGAAWEHLEEGATNAWKDLETAVREARSEF